MVISNIFVFPRPRVVAAQDGDRLQVLVDRINRSRSGITLITRRDTQLLHQLHGGWFFFTPAYLRLCDTLVDFVPYIPPTPQDFSIDCIQDIGALPGTQDCVVQQRVAENAIAFPKHLTDVSFSEDALDLSHAEDWCDSVRDLFAIRSIVGMKQ